MKELCYMDALTGETTTDHRTACTWYRNGAEIQLYTHDGTAWAHRCTWYH